MRSNIVTEAGLPTRLNQWWTGVPFITSSVTVVCGIIYLVCLLVGYDSFIEICFLPSEVISKFQAYRIYTSVLFHGSILHIVFNMLALVPLGTELERIMGSIRLLYLMFLLATTNAIMHLIIALIVAYNPLHPYPFLMHECAIGFSGVIFSMIVIETNLSGVQTKSVFGLLNVPAKWYAWILLVLFQLLASNVSLLGHLCGILSGFAYSYGLFNYLLPGSSFYGTIESSSLLMTTSEKKKIIWTDKLTEKFIKVCASQVKEGNRPTTYLNKKGWAKVQEELKFDLKQLKNKWDTLKKEWQLWKRLLGKETDLRWNSEKKTIEASDDWWEAKIKEVPGVAKFREKGLPLPDDMDLVFGDVVATGAQAWAPSSGVLPDQPELDMYLEGLGDSEDDPPPAPIVQASGHCSEVAQKGKGKRVQQSSSKKQERKRQSVGTSVQDSLERLSDVVESMSKHTEVKECVKVLQALGLKNDMTFYTKCLCLLAEKKDARRFLLCLDDKESQLSFITMMVEDWKK